MVFWLFAAVLIGYCQIKQRNRTELPVKFTSFSFDISLIALVFAARALVILSYFQVLASAPMRGIVGGDVLDYMVSANRFIWSDFSGWSPYVWSNNFYWLISNLAGLPMHLVYAGLQFYLIIPIASFYFLVRTIFPNYKKIAALATLLCFFVAGVTSWLLLNQKITSSSDIFQYTGAPGITPFALSPWIFDFGFLFFSLAFVYKAVFNKERRLINYVLPSIFIVAAYFSHNFNIIFVFVFAIIFLVLFQAGSRRYILKLSLLTLVLALVLDPLSKWMLVDTIFATAVRLDLQLTSALSIYFLVIGLVAVGIIILFILFSVKKRNLHLRFRRSSILVKLSKIDLSNNKIKMLFYLASFIFFGILVTLYLRDYTKFLINPSVYEPNFLFPKDMIWYWVVFRSFGIILPFALASIPFLVHRERNPSIFTAILAIAIFVSTIVSVSFPQIIPPYIGYFRYAAYLVIPLSILAAFGIFNSVQQLKKRHFKAIFVIVLVVLVSTSILSQAYVREKLYVSGQNASGQNPLISDDMASAIGWINDNVPKGATILTLSNDSEKILSNLVLGVKVTPNFQTWYLKDVLSNSTSEVVLNCLNTLGVDYVFVESTLDDSNFNSVIQSFPRAQTFDQAVIYRVPSEDWSLPYFSSLFQKITFSLYEQHIGSTPINNKVIWFSNITANGNVNITSNNINLNSEKLSVTSMNVKTSDRNAIFENKTLYGVGLNGAGEIMIGSSKSVKFANSSALNTYVTLTNEKNVTLSFSEVDIHFKDGTSSLNFKKANVTVALDSVDSLVAICMQPIITVNGNMSGNATGLVHTGLLQGVTFNNKWVALKGEFTTEIPFADSLLYSQITSAKELKVTFPDNVP